MFPNTYTTSPPTYAPAATIRKPMIDRTTGTVLSVGFDARIPSEINRRSKRDDHQGRVKGRPDAGGPVRVGIVSGTSHGSREHEQDRRDEGDVSGGRLAEKVEDDRHEEGPDRDVCDRRMQRVTEPRAVQPVLDRTQRAGRERSASGD